MNAIAAVIDMVLLNQNSEQESINVIFPSGFLYVYPHLGACMIIIQTLQNQKTHTCPSTSVVWLYWSAFHTNVFLFCFSSHLILACFYLVPYSFFWFYNFPPTFCKVMEIPKNVLSSFIFLFSSVAMLLISLSAPSGLGRRTGKKSKSHGLR